MTWLLWRQHRTQGLVSTGLLAVLGVLLLVTGLQMAHDYHAMLAGCASNPACGEVSLFQGDGAIIDLVNATVLVPPLIGAFWGATIVGRELETGTQRLVWTQTVTRRRWLRDKLGLLVAMTLVVSAAVAAMVTQWSYTLNAYRGSRFDGLQFDIQGVAPVGYALFAAALGLLAGVLWRRAVPAIATTVAAYFAVRLPVEVWLRPHLQHALTLVGPLGPNVNAPAGAWTISEQIYRNGRLLTGPIRVPDQCAGLGRDQVRGCLSKLGFSTHITYQPAGRFWTFQWIELGIFVALAVVLTAAAVVALRRRDA